MYSVKITNAEKLNVQSDGSTILAIDFDVIQTVEGSEPVTVAHYSHGFALNTSPEDVTAYFQDYVANYTANEARRIANADIDAANAVADATIEAITGIDIKSE